MKIENYIKRKYPESYEEILNTFSEKDLNDLRMYKRKIGRLTRNYYFNSNLILPHNKIGDLCIWVRKKNVDGYGNWWGSFKVRGFVNNGKYINKIMVPSYISIRRGDIIEITK